MDENIEQRYLDNSEAGFASKLIAGVLDAAVAFGLTFLLGKYIVSSSFWNSITSKSPALVLIAIFIIYRVLALTIFKQSIGMFVSRIKLLDKNLLRPVLKDLFLVAFFIPVAKYYKK